ncbi:hypothetical protein [Scytonema hofmannii]|uniref:hypothetical protein n=1 Tax=Scytonema hofmannii TaxID=34078 RepID=UPI000348FA04|nr:hypothetical protein [Scytonema hofmannii]
MNILDLSSKKIAALYRALYKERSQAPIGEQWKYGSQLKYLEAAFIVTREEEELFGKGR